VTYFPPFILRNGHFQSIYPSLFRKVPSIPCVRERIDTPDGDFLDIDWSINNNKRLVILSHGLEGHSRRPYIMGMAKYAQEHKWDSLSWNFRGCSDTPNHHPHSYHSGKTEDLALVIAHALKQGYIEIALIGFSIGGNKTLLHLGRNSKALPKEVIAAVGISVPCDLTSCSRHLAQLSHKLYMQNFLKSFKLKLEEKQSRFPDIINIKDFHKLKNFKDYDQRYTAPLNGFKSAEQYWEESSCLFYLNKIKVPCLILNALDDPFLPDECYPVDYVAKNPNLVLEMPKYGGHVGFMPENRSLPYFSERRAIQFINKFSNQTESV
tara:strand:+ start:2951 stop:3916 length:966 start_codon:yes stop_codon:yes gene_type:complete